MKYLSVCSGIEAATVAWHPLGWTPAAFSEIEKFPSAVLAHHYPHVPNLGDMTKFKDWNLDAIDLLVGGTPCQSFSIAGLRKGLDDPRGNLMLTYLAIANRHRPKWLVWENVPGVLSSNGGKDFGTFLGGLAELGYGFAYRVLDAQYIRTHGHSRAVPQRRRRVFVVGCLGGWRSAAAVLFERHSVSGHPAPRRQAGQGIAGTISSRTTGDGGLGTDFELAGGLQPVAGTLNSNAKAAGSATSQDAESGLLIPVRALGPILAFGGSNTTGSIDVATARNACASASGRMDFESETFIVQPSAVSVALRRHHGRAAAELGDDLAFTLRASSGGSDKPHVLAFDCNASGQSGFGIGEVASTMRAMSSANSHQNGGGHQAVLSEMRVRRLTPRECARLQGFPDDYLSQVLYRRKLPADGPMYKAFGNSMAIPPMHWIGSRIQMVNDL